MTTHVRAVVAFAALTMLIAGCAAPSSPVDPPLPGDGPSDPEEDVLGWEGGYWHDETLPIDAADGLNESELDALVRRSMARVEHLRGLEFEEPVPVEVVSRAAFREQVAGGDDADGPSARQVFDDVTLEALFLVGERTGVDEAQGANRASTVLGFYSPSGDRIVVISETETPRIGETTLAHELVHALQFRTFPLGYNESTRDQRSASRALVEGDASYVDHLYERRCEEAWTCVTPEADDGGPGADGDGNDTGINMGLAILEYFPYSDGAAFVRHFERRGGWERVAALYGTPPESSEQVVDPREYRNDTPSTIALRDRTGPDWERVRPEGRPDYGAVGMAGLTAALAHPAYDDARAGGVLAPREFLNASGGTPDALDPLNYGTEPVAGWDGDRLHVYRNGGKYGYVWRLAWDDERDAREFADAYRELLAYWGGERVTTADGAEVWRIPEGESEFADAFAVAVEGETVTIVNAPAVGALDDVRAGTAGNATGDAVDG